MIELNAWESLSLACRFGVALVVVIKLTRFYDHYRIGERIGLGIAGGCALLSMGVVMQGDTSPFRDWANASFALGVLIYFCGRLHRQLRHDAANRAHLRRAHER